MSDRRYTLNDLPEFSRWPARLLGIEPWNMRSKTPAEIEREFGQEKWGALLERVRQARTRVLFDEVERWVFEQSPECLCSIGDTFERLSAFDAHRKYLDLVADVLEPYLPAPALVEFGAGYGSVILALAQRHLFADTKMMAGEYTQSGVELMRRLADAQGCCLEVGHCDFASPSLTDLSFPKDSVVFTSYATHYVPALSDDFITALRMHSPSVVIHFEPCYEHCDPMTLLGLMRRRYIEVNDYNANLVTLLHQQQAIGKINILREQAAIFGSNPLLPCSIIIWEFLK